MQYQAHIILKAFAGSMYPAAKVQVEAENEQDALEAVFSLAQNIDESWIDDPRVLAVFEDSVPQPASPRPRGLRSLSVGDRVHLIGRGSWKCESVGWVFWPIVGCWKASEDGTHWELSVN